MGRYSLSEEQKKQFAGIYVLEYIINKPRSFALLLRDEDADLEPVLEWLLIKEYIKILDKEKYVPTEKGRDALSKFMARYAEFLNIFDIYCAVDLGEGEFAFSSYFDYDNPQEWRSFLNKERWEDLRVAVAEFKKLDPVEIVFMNFINENRFGKNATGWQFDLLLGTVWDEILEICESAVHYEDLGYEDEEGAVNAEDVIKDIIKQGAELLVELKKKEALLAPPIDHGNNGDRGNGQEEEYVERVDMEPYPMDYYHSYYDPYYVSPLWLGIWLI